MLLKLLARDESELFARACERASLQANVRASEQACVRACVRARVRESADVCVRARVLSLSRRRFSGAHDESELFTRACERARARACVPLMVPVIACVRASVVRA